MDKILKLLEDDATLTAKQLSVMLDKEVGDIKKTISAYEKDGVILGYKTIIDWDKTDKEYVTALIEVKLTPQKDLGFDKVAEKVVNPLKGRKIGAYYGCLLLRPGSVMKMDDPENPTILEDLIRAMGAEPVIYANRNECCGGYISLKEPEMAKNMSTNIANSAESFGAEMLITACPLCRYNLNKSQAELPVYYFTELLAEALGLKEAATK